MKAFLQQMVRVATTVLKMVKLFFVRDLET